MAISVIIWVNQGVRKVVPCTTEKDALAQAREARTLDNRTVKIADAFGSTHHWSRSVHLTQNHWSARVVAGEAFG